VPEESVFPTFDPSRRESSSHEKNTKNTTVPRTEVRKSRSAIVTYCRIGVLAIPDQCIIVFVWNQLFAADRYELSALRILCYKKIPLSNNGKKRRIKLSFVLFRITPSDGIDRVIDCFIRILSTIDRSSSCTKYQPTDPSTKYIDRGIPYPASSGFYNLKSFMIATLSEIEPLPNPINSTTHREVLRARDWGRNNSGSRPGYGSGRTPNSTNGSCSEVPRATGN